MILPNKPMILVEVRYKYMIICQGIILSSTAYKIIM